MTPSYQQKSFSDTQKKNQWALIVSPDNSAGSLKIHQDVRIYSSLLEMGKSLEFDVPKDRYAWLQVAEGAIQVGETKLEKGDGLSISFAEPKLLINGSAEVSDIILFDLA